MLSYIVASLMGVLPQSGQPVQVIQQPIAQVMEVPESNDTPPTMSDEDALKAVRIDPNNSEALLDYIRSRTLNDIDLTSITEVIDKLGDDNFDHRLAAQQRLINFGPAASGPLRKIINESSADPEIAYRAQKCLDEMEQVPHERVAVAVVRRLAETRPPNTAKVLLDYLPLVGDRKIQHQIHTTLATIARSSDKPDPALIEALNAKFSETRLAAALALIQRDLLKAQPDLQKKITETAQRETDTSAQFQMLFALAQATNDLATIDAILRTLTNLPRGRLWQAEDFLLQLAGEQAPKATFGKSKQEVQEAALVWQRWWQGQRLKIDMTKFTYKPRTTGGILLSLQDTNFGGPGKLVELDPDLNVAWEIDNLSLPSDMLTMPDGTIAIAEMNANRVTIRNTQGQILREMSTISGKGRQPGSPLKLQLLDNGNMIVVCRNQVLEFKKGTDDVVMSYFEPTHNIASALRLSNGETCIVFQRGTVTNAFLDKDGKQIENRKLSISKASYQADMNLADNDHIVVTELSRIAEYDITTGKEVWQINASHPTCVQRLFNGNTLYVAGASGEIKEIDPEGQTVWDYKFTDKDKMSVYRARRQ